MRLGLDVNKTEIIVKEETEQNIHIGWPHSNRDQIHEKNQRTPLRNKHIWS